MKFTYTKLTKYVTKKSPTHVRNDGGMLQRCVIFILKLLEMSWVFAISDFLFTVLGFVSCINKV